MCGIAGIVDLKGRQNIDRPLLERMTNVLSHRGPDGMGIHLEQGTGLGHRRLAIIDRKAGQQPLYNEDGSVVVVYNGEIYNFERLARELAGLGHEFRTHCDTEVIVHAWEQWGPSCVDRFRGMFAFAIWDGNTETLFLARDRLGIKPLFYTVLADGRVAFASELKALYEIPGLSREIDPFAVEEYFAFGYIPDPRTILSGVYKLAPAHTLLLRRGTDVVLPKQYWDVAFSVGDVVSQQESEEELIQRLKEAVRLRMISEVPLGAFLSGGVDSSAVVAMMSELDNEPVNTCSISFGESSFDESVFAQRVAALFGTYHREEMVDRNDFSLVDTLAGLYDEPYADSSAIPTYRVCELASKNVTVVLSGDGGDEAMAGYRRYRWHMNEERVRGLVPLAFRRQAFGMMGAIYPKADWAPRIFRAKTTFQSLARDSISAYFHSVSVLNERNRSSLFSSALKRELQGYTAVEVLRKHDQGANVEDPLGRIQYLDFKTYLPGDILTKVDRASMAHSLEVRVPILDHPLVEWLATLPSDCKLRKGEGKYLFKRALQSRLPREILYRPKMGFAVPLASWFRGALAKRVRETLLSERIAGTGMFDMKFLSRLVDQHQSGLRDNSAAIWSMFMFESFLRRFGSGLSSASVVPIGQGRKAS